jgi:uncharacterized membrane protein
MEGAMTVRDQEFSGRWPHAGLAVLLSVVAGGALWFVVHKTLLYTAFDPVTYDDLWPRRLGFLPHMVGGTVAVLSGVVQLWLGLTGRTAGWHRVLGRIYVGGVAVGAAGGFYLALTLPYGGFAYAAGLFLLAVAWTVTTAMAILAIRHRAVEQHREWMIRSYIVTFAFVTYRVLASSMTDWKIAPDAEIQTFAAFACWSVPLLIAEPFLQFRKARGAG